jgi:O-antigen/teichoic acid export membrane protein
MESNNKRIAKNTVFLYIRMLITMVVSLYTSRVVLSTLGVTDFGIYNVVGGVVAMFGFITNTMASASQRFLAYDLGINDYEQLKRTFSITVSIYLLFAIIIIILAETIGLWFVYYKLTIPPERFRAALFVYQFSILAFLANILRIPYNAAIIAHEKMGFYAWSTIIETVLKLLIVFMLVWFSYDKLAMYGVLMFAAISLVTLMYVIFCRIKFKETKYHFIWDKTKFKEMFGFAGWNLFDSTAIIAKNEGVNILLNIFFTPAINAARGVAFQVSSQVVSFVGNFQMAAAPQIIKYYAARETEQMKKLYFSSSKYTYFLLLFITIPVFLNLNQLLNWWLKEVPEYTLIFIQLILINRLVDSLAGMTNVVIQATGKLKAYQVFSGLTMLMNLPISYLVLKLGFTPQTTIIVSIAISFIIVIGRIWIMSKLTAIKIREYINNVIKYNIMVSIFSFLIPYYFAEHLVLNLLSFFLICIVSVIVTIVSIYFLGVNKKEKKYILKIVRNKIISFKE